MDAPYIFELKYMEALFSFTQWLVRVGICLEIKKEKIAFY